MKENIFLIYSQVGKDGDQIHLYLMNTNIV